MDRIRPDAITVDGEARHNQTTLGHFDVRIDDRQSHLLRRRSDHRNARLHHAAGEHE
jgi:hypothetical protein